MTLKKFSNVIFIALKLLWRSSPKSHWTVGIHHFVICANWDFQIILIIFQNFHRSGEIFKLKFMKRNLRANFTIKCGWKSVLKNFSRAFLLFKKWELFFEISNCIFKYEKKTFVWANTLEFWIENWSQYIKSKIELHNLPLDFWCAVWPKSFI